MEPAIREERYGDTPSKSGDPLGIAFEGMSPNMRRMVSLTQRNPKLRDARSEQIGDGACDTRRKVWGHTFQIR